MPIEIGIWRVEQTPQAIVPSMLDAESRLEQWLVDDISLIAPNLLVIGRQVRTPFGGIIDILAMDANGDLTVLELKRDRTPREVVAQLLDYASWVNTLSEEKVGEIFQKFQSDRGVFPTVSIDDAYKSRFSATALPETLNENHQLIIVASELDESTERIVTYLSETHNVQINAIFFRFFKDGDREYLTRAWFRDPAGVDLSETRGNVREQWKGEYYGSFGGGRDWECARKYGYFAAGGGTWYSRTLALLEPGARLWVNNPAHGYVGVGTVMESRVKADEFMVQAAHGAVPITEQPDCDPEIKEALSDANLANYLVRVEWTHSVPLSQAVRERGFFGNQNSVCQPRASKWEYTVNRLKEVWNIS